MAINVALSVQYNGGILPDIILRPIVTTIGEPNPFTCHAEVLPLQPLVPPKRFDISPANGGILRRSRCVQSFLLKNKQIFEHFHPVDSERADAERDAKTSLARDQILRREQGRKEGNNQFSEFSYLY